MTRIASPTELVTLSQAQDLVPRPLQIELTEEEILADLLYPARPEGWSGAPRIGPGR